MGIKDKVAEAMVRKELKKRWKLMDRYFKGQEDSEWPDQVIQKYEIMKYAWPKYPEIIKQWHACIMRCFELEGKDTIIINGETLEKEKEIEAYEDMKAELESFEYSLKQTK